MHLKNPSILKVTLPVSIAPWTGGTSRPFTARPTRYIRQRTTESGNYVPPRLPSGIENQQDTPIKVNPLITVDVCLGEYR